MQSPAFKYNKNKTYLICLVFKKPLNLKQALDLTLYQHKPKSHSPNFNLTYNPLNPKQFSTLNQQIILRQFQLTHLDFKVKNQLQLLRKSQRNTTQLQSLQALMPGQWAVILLIFHLVKHQRYRKHPNKNQFI